MKSLLFSLLLLSAIATHAQQGFMSISSVTVLLTLPSTARGIDYFAEGLTASGDGSQATGIYHWTPASTATTNLYPGVFVPTRAPTNGRWIKQSGPVFNYTLTGSETGSTNIAKAAGKVIFPVNATTLTVTNALVTTDSLVLATLNLSDATAKSVSATAGAGVITLTLAVTNTLALPASFIVIQ